MARRPCSRGKRRDQPMEAISRRTGLVAKIYALVLVGKPLDDTSHALGRSRDFTQIPYLLLGLLPPKQSHCVSWRRRFPRKLRLARTIRATIGSIPAYVAWRYAPIHFHDYAVVASSQRSFRGFGPSIAWNASAPFAGNSDRREISLDWGANAAVLFGRQKAKGHSQKAVQTYYKNDWHGTAGHGRFVNMTLFHGLEVCYTGGAIARHTELARVV